MKRTLTLTLFVCLFAATASAAIEGAWTASIDEKHPDLLWMNLTTGKHHNMGTTMRLSDFANLTTAQMNATTTTPVAFEMRREAGTISFDGTFRNGKGAGQLAFAPNRGYINAVKALGVEFELEHKRKNRDEEDTLFTLALHDVSTAFIRSMQAEGYRVSLEKYLTMRIFNITPEYIREMKSLGFSNLDDDAIVSTRIHKVTPEYVRKMRAAGYNLSLDDYQSFSIHKVTLEYIDELRKLGYDKLSADDLVAMRIHKVTPEFIRELQEAGYKNIPPDKLVEMRIHKIDARYLKKMNG